MFTERAKELSRIIEHTRMPEFKLSGDLAYEVCLNEIERTNISDIRWLLATAFQAGKIEGIRQERQRKKQK